MYIIYHCGLVPMLIWFNVVCGMQDPQGLRGHKDQVARLVSLVNPVSKVCLELMVTLEVQDLRDNEGTLVSQAGMVPQDPPDPREVVEVRVSSGSLEIPETQEILVGLDSLVMLDRKDRLVPLVLLVRKEQSVQWASLGLWARRDNVDRLVLTDSQAGLEIPDQLATLETLVLLDKQDSRDPEEVWDLLVTLVPQEILASMDSKV